MQYLVLPTTRLGLKMGAEIVPPGSVLTDPEGAERLVARGNLLPLTDQLIATLQTTTAGPSLSSPGPSVPPPLPNEPEAVSGTVSGSPGVTVIGGSGTVTLSAVGATAVLTSTPHTVDEIAEVSKIGDLRDRARQLGLETGGSKTEIIERILESGNTVE